MIFKCVSDRTMGENCSGGGAFHHCSIQPFHCTGGERAAGLETILAGWSTFSNCQRKQPIPQEAHRAMTFPPVMYALTFHEYVHESA